MTIPRRTTTQLRRVSPETLAESKAAKERRAEAERIFGKPIPSTERTFTNAEYLRSYYERHEFTGD